MGPDRPWVLGLVKYIERSLYTSTYFSILHKKKTKFALFTY